MRAAGLATLIALGAMLSACDNSARLDGLADGGVASVASVVDGDTLTLTDGRRIDLAGVATPRDGEAYAGEARAALEKAALGRRMRLLYGGAAEGPFHLQDTRRRTWVQEELLASGAARVRTDVADRALAREMMREEARARAERRGLWALSQYEVRLPNEVIARGDTGFLVVEGRVLRAAEQAGRLYLEFSRDWRGGFSAETALKDVGAFTDAGVDLKGMEGRLVRVRGEVRRTAYGPRLLLDHPEQVERLEAAPASR